MQRVLYEILRRSCDSDRTNKKRKHDFITQKDGKYAEELYDRENRGHRPGMMNYHVKRRRTEESEPVNAHKRHATVAY